MSKVSFLFLCLIFSYSCSLIDSTRKPASPNSKNFIDRPPQFVLLAFDGSQSLKVWDKTLQFADQENIKFTYFVSGVYFVAKADRERFYTEPRLGPGKSAIGWGRNERDISIRYRYLKKAIIEGHEIASHGNGHYSGEANRDLKLREARFEDWQSEFDQYKTIMTEGVYRYNVNNMPDWWYDYFGGGNIGFRAPQLGHNEAMYPALKNSGYKYDTSKIREMNYWPKKIDGIWDFPLAGVRMSRTQVATVSMDYNFYYKDSRAEEADAYKWEYFEEQMFETYLTYFKHNYFGNRAPVDIGHHFSEWNGGAYWRALKRFASIVCHQPEVRCVTYTDLMNYLEDTGADDIAKYQKGDFQKMNSYQSNLPNVLKRASSRSTQELSEEELQELRENVPHTVHGEVNTNIEI